MEFQSLLGLPELDRNETRQNLSDYFEMYREYKQILAMGGHEPSVTAQASKGIDLPGADPDTIRAQYKFSSSTESATLINERMQRHIDRIDRAVNRMFQERAEIIRRKFLTDSAEIPKDEKVHEDMVRDGFAMGFKKWEETKAKALWSLAFALGVAQFVEEK